MPVGRGKFCIVQKVLWDKGTYPKGLKRMREQVEEWDIEDLYIALQSKFRRGVGAFLI